METEQEEDSQSLRGKVTRTFGEITFNSNFDSGNLDRVEECRPSSPGSLCFNLWTAPDCAGTEYENGNRSWFYFSVACQPPPENTSRSWTTIRMSIMNLNKQVRLYQQGLTPFVKGRTNTWERMREKPIIEMGPEGMMLTFEFTPPEAKQRTLTFFAFCYPYSYAECQKYLARIDRRMIAKQQQSPKDSEDSIYYNRQTLCYSLDRLTVDLLTISSHHGLTMESEPDLPGLYPDTSKEKPRLFHNKRVVFITSRVHPGETPSSYVFNGVLDFILNPDDPRAKILRQHFVFKMVPMLNPDGVKRGHYRTDSRGVNLNRMYIDPHQDLHPAVFCVRSLILYYHMGVVTPCMAVHNVEASTSDHAHLHMSAVDPSTGDCDQLHSSAVDPPTSDRDQLHSSHSSVVDPSTSDHTHLHSAESVESNSENRKPETANKKQRVAVYVDLHAHATKRGCFMYGNHFSSPQDHAECMVFPKLVSLNSAHFDYGHCVFSERNMCAVDKRDGFIGKEGSGRVAIYKATGLIQSYTLECNYNSGARMNGLLPATLDGGRATPPSTSSPIPYKYISSNYAEVGRGLAMAILDLYQLNPWSRIPNSEFSTLAGLRLALLQTVQHQRDKTTVVHESRQPRVLLKQWSTAGRKCDEEASKETITVSNIAFKDLKEESNDEQMITQQTNAKRFSINSQVSIRKVLRRHTSPSLLIRPQSHKFIYSTSCPYFLNSAASRDVSNSVQLPIVQPSNHPIHQTLLHAIRNQTIDREVIHRRPGEPLTLLSKFAVIGQKVLATDHHDNDKQGGNRTRGKDVKESQRKTLTKGIKKSPSPRKIKQKKLASRPPLLGRPKARRTSTVITENHSSVVELASTVLKK